MSIFPNVPFAPGVPPLLRDTQAVFSKVVLMVSDAITILNMFLPPQWGLFKDGFPVVAADNVLSFDFRNDFSISTYPQEEGSFQSYNKVSNPFDVRLRFSIGGSESDRRSLLRSIAAIAGSLDLFDAVCPERIYPSVNVTHYDYRRTATNGLGLLVIDVWCTQVRVTGGAAFSNKDSTAIGAFGSSTTGGAVGVSTQQPSATTPIGVGNVQPTDAPTAIGISSS